jgi:hypothetical protein
MLLELFDLCHTDFQHTLNVFQHLREIDLSFTYRGKALNETYFKAGYMARILSSAKLRSWRSTLIWTMADLFFRSPCCSENRQYGRALDL